MSKQAVHQSRQRQLDFDLELIDLANQVALIRRDHPGCGLEKLYHTLKPSYIGRDKFCEIFMGLGYGVKEIKNYRRTTIPSWFKFPNLIEGMSVTRPYQVLQSDITYFDIDGTFYYLVFIMDVYTRKILGYNAGDNMRAQCNVKALKMALRKIPKEDRKGMIHHSDRGVQFVSHEYLKVIKENDIEVSMAGIAQENAYVEKLNSTIKNEYLKRWNIPDFRTLVRKTSKAVNNYNTNRLHLAFDNKYTPTGFKNSLVCLSDQERPKVIIYSEGNFKVKVASSHLNFRSAKEPQAHNCPIVI